LESIRSSIYPKLHSKTLAVSLLTNIDININLIVILVTDVAILMVVFNAAKECTTMTDLFEEHIRRHYFYLRDTYPSLVPRLQILCSESDQTEDNCNDVTEGQTRSHEFLLGIFKRIRNVMSLDGASNQIQSSVLEHSIRFVIKCYKIFLIHFFVKIYRDLQQLGEVERSLSAASKFLCSYLRCQMSLRKVYIH